MSALITVADVRNIIRKRRELPRASRESMNASANRRMTPVASSAAARPNDPITNQRIQLLECANASLIDNAPMARPMPSMAMVVIASGSDVATHQMTASASRPRRAIPTSVTG